MVGAIILGLAGGTCGSVFHENIVCVPGNANFGPTGGGSECSLNVAPAGVANVPQCLSDLKLLA